MGEFEPPEGVPPARADADPDAARFYFYFREEAPARTAAAELKGGGYDVRTTPPDDQIAEWSVVASGVPSTPDIVTAEAAFEPWAQKLGGEYDGNEIKVSG